MLVSLTPHLSSRKQIALPLPVALNIGLHELAQHVGRSSISFLADGNERFAQAFLDPDSDAGIFHAERVPYGYTFVYPYGGALDCQAVKEYAASRPADRCLKADGLMRWLSPAR